MPKLNDRVTILGMDAKIVGIDGDKVTYHLGSQGVCITIDTTDEKQPKAASRALPGVETT